MAVLLGRTVGELEATISPQELVAWSEYLAEEPAHADRSEAQLAMIAHMVSNFMGGKHEVTDFMISRRPKQEELEILDISGQALEDLVFSLF